jgi:hypothetical protein
MYTLIGRVRLIYMHVEFFMVFTLPYLRRSFKCL